MLITRENRLQLAKLLCTFLGRTWAGLPIEDRHELLDIAADTLAVTKEKIKD